MRQELDTTRPPPGKKDSPNPPRAAVGPVARPALRLGPRPRAAARVPPADGEKGGDAGDERERAREEGNNLAASDSLRSYLQEIRRYRLLTPEEETALGKEVQAGKHAERLLGRESVPEGRRRKLERTRRAGQAARDAMIRSNLRLVVSIARRYRVSGLPLEDRIQEGNIGLMRAVAKFDWQLGFRFSTYATYWVRQVIQRAIADQSRAIRIPVHLQDVLSRARRATLELEAGLGREPSDEEVAAAAGLPPERLQELRLVTRNPLSLDLPVADDDSGTLGEFVTDETFGHVDELVLAEMDRASLHVILSTLDEGEQRIMTLRFGLDGEVPLTLDEVGRQLGVPRERVRQRTGEILAKLRASTG